MKSPTKVIAIAAAFVTVASLAACSPDSGSGDGRIELRVATFPPGAEVAAYEAFEAQEKQFEALHPDIDIIGVEYNWTGPTFAAQLAAGSLPDVFVVPITDTQTLIANQQLGDVTKDLADLGYKENLNPVLLKEVSDSSGNVFGFPRQAYALGLHYNRDLFTQAGLDPDSPPQTWDEVREYAKQIADKTGKAGYATMASGNTGGWQLTAQATSRGGHIQSADGKTSTVDDPSIVSTLEYFKKLRWDDNSMGDNFLLDWGTINQEFAAGNIGMYTSGSDVYTALVRDFGLNPDIYGLTVIPTENGDNVLGGGDVAVIPPTLEGAKKDAAIKWIDWYYMQKLVNEDAAVQDAKTLADSGQPVGTPVLPVLDKATYEKSLTWIAPYVNVPVDQMKGFTERIFDMTPVPQPISKTQEIYAILDNLVQAVLTDQNADIKALVAKANQDAQALIDG